MNAPELRLQDRIAAALRSLIDNPQLEQAWLADAPVRAALLHASARFVEETFNEALAMAGKALAQGHEVSLRWLSPTAHDEAAALAAVDQYVVLLLALNLRGLSASLALDVGQIGAAFNPPLAFRHALALAQAANADRVTLLLDGGDPALLTTSASIYERLIDQSTNVGLTLSAAQPLNRLLMRSVLGKRGQFRLIQTASHEETLDMTAINERFFVLMKQCLDAGRLVAVCAQDPVLIEGIANASLPKDQIVFEMSQGVNTELLNSLRDRGFRTRLYIPYGPEWPTYLAQRLIEAAPNEALALRDALETVSENED